jgi:hypothetical protein
MVVWFCFWMMSSSSFGFMAVALCLLPLSLVELGLLDIQRSGIALIAQVLIWSVFGIVYPHTGTVLPHGASVAENGEAVVLINPTDTYTSARHAADRTAYDSLVFWGLWASGRRVVVAVDAWQDGLGMKRLSQE